MNRFVEPDAGGPQMALQRIDPAIEREQVARLETYRAERDAGLVEERLAGVRRAAEGSENLMPHFVESVDAGASLGEICNVLRGAFGTYVASEIVG